MSFEEGIIDGARTAELDKAIAAAAAGWRDIDSAPQGFCLVRRQATAEPRIMWHRDEFWNDEYNRPHTPPRYWHLEGTAALRSEVKADAHLEPK